MSSGWLHRGVALIFLGMLAASVAPVAGEAQGAIELEKLKAQTLQLIQSGQYPEATEIAKRSLALAEKLHGRDHPEVATALITLGMLLGITNRLAEAEPLSPRAGDRREAPWSRAFRCGQRSQEPGRAARGHQPACRVPSLSIAAPWRSTRRALVPSIPTSL